MRVDSRLPSQPPPAFLSTGTAALLAAAPPPTDGGAAMSPGLEGLDAPACRLYEELLRRLEAGENRLYAADLQGACALASADLESALRELRQAGCADWDAGGPYLYLRRPSTAPGGATGDTPGDTTANAPAPPAGPVAPAASSAPVVPTPAPLSGPAAPAPADSTPDGREAEVAKVFAALEWATGGTLSPLARERIPEWLSVLGVRGVLDEIGLCREQGRRRFNQLSLALDRACSRRRTVSPFGPLDGRGVISTATGAPFPPGKSGAMGPEPVPNIAAYDPVAPQVVKAWVEAHPDLAASDPVPPADWAAGRERQGTWASAYDQVPEAVVRAWVEAFSEEYREYQREYRRLAERSGSGPFRPHRPRVR